MTTPKDHPGRQLTEVTLSDVTEYNPAFRFFHANTSGTVFVDTVDGGVNVPLVVVEGGIYPYEVTRFYAAGATPGMVIIGVR